MVKKRRKKATRFPTPDEMAVMDDILSIEQNFPGADIAAWRKMRQLCGRMIYEERTGEVHPAWEGTGEIDPMTRAEFDIAPPDGALWAEFGETWDLAPLPTADGDYEPIRRHVSMRAQWATLMGAQAEPLELSKPAQTTPE